MNENQTFQQETMREKYRLKFEYENLIHHHIMEEIRAAAKAGATSSKRRSKR